MDRNKGPSQCSFASIRRNLLRCYVESKIFLFHHHEDVVDSKAYGNVAS